MSTLKLLLLLMACRESYASGCDDVVQLLFKMSCIAAAFYVGEDLQTRK